MIKKHLSDEQYKRLLWYLAQPEMWEEETAVVDLLMRTGMRQAELIKLRPESFDLERRYIAIEPAKGSKYRICKIAPDVWKRMSYLVDLMKISGVPTLGHVFSNSNDLLSQKRQVRRMVAKVLDKALGRGHGFTVHCLRHTYALKCFKRFDNDLIKTQKAMGHKNVQNTAKYLEYLQSEDLADDIMEAVGE